MVLGWYTLAFLNREKKGTLCCFFFFSNFEDGARRVFKGEGDEGEVGEAIKLS